MHTSTKETNSFPTPVRNNTRWCDKVTTAVCINIGPRGTFPTPVGIGIGPRGRCPTPAHIST